MTMDLSITVVNSDGKKLTLECLESIYKNAKGFSLEVILVDNYSSDGSVAAIKQQYPQVRLIESKERKGFTANQNMAIRAAKGAYILVLNNDTIILNDALKQMLDFMKATPDAGATGCQLLNPDGSFQAVSLRGEYNLLAFFSVKTGLSRLFPKSRIWGKVHLGYLDRNQIQKIDAFSGSAVMIRKKVFEEIGLLDENIFFGPDDLDFSYRLRRAGYSIYYYPNAQIIHYWGQSAKENTPKHFAIELRGIFYFYLKHYGVARSIVLCVLVFLTDIVHVILNFLKYILGINRAKSLIWLKAYLETIKVCLTYKFQRV